MEINGRIKSIGETKTFGDNGFKKRELVVTTNDEYPQHLLLEFVQDKCDVLNDYKTGQDVEIGINLRGREWQNPDGEIKYFNTIQGWRIKLKDGNEPAKEQTVKQVNPVAQDNDLPF